MVNRKLGRPTDQRMAMLRNQVTNLIWYGKIETTLARGKEVQALAEHLITVAMRQCDNTVEVTKKHMNELLAQMTGQSLERIQQDVERDYFMSPEAAKEYGLIDEIIKPRA